MHYGNISSERYINCTGAIIEVGNVIRDPEMDEKVWIMLECEVDYIDNCWSCM